MDRNTAIRIADALQQAYPGKFRTLLNFRNPYELLTATILSARVTDKLINSITPALFERFPDPASLAAASQEEVESYVKSAGFYRNKAKSLRLCCQALCERHGCEVPATMEELVKLPGVGRKTAAVVLSNCFDVPAIPVDTHVRRTANRLGFTDSKDPQKIEQAIAELVPRDRWSAFAHHLTYLGRDFCFARKPACDRCPVAGLCPYKEAT